LSSERKFGGKIHNKEKVLGSKFTGHFWEKKEFVLYSRLKVILGIDSLPHLFTTTFPGIMLLVISERHTLLCLNNFQKFF